MKTAVLKSEILILPLLVRYENLFASFLVFVYIYSNHVFLHLQCMQCTHLELLVGQKVSCFLTGI